MNYNRLKGKAIQSPLIKCLKRINSNKKLCIKLEMKIMAHKGPC